MQLFSAAVLGSKRNKEEKRKEQTGSGKVSKDRRHKRHLADTYKIHIESTTLVYCYYTGYGTHPHYRALAFSESGLSGRP